MPDVFTVSLGDIPIALVPSSQECIFDSFQRTSDFASDSQPAISLQVHCGDFPDTSNASIVFDTDLSWLMLSQADKRLIKVRSSADKPHMLGIFPTDFLSGDIYVSTSPRHPGKYIFPFTFPMGILFLMNLLGTGLGVLFHASGVVVNGEGYLFTGHGGVGKTTTARLWEQRGGAVVLSDDKVIVRKVNGSYRMYGTPWPGEGGMASPMSAPLRKVFVLRQAQHNEAEVLPPTEAVGKLLARCFMPLWDKSVVDFSLGFLEKLTQTVPCYELGFKPDLSVLDLVVGLPSQVK